LVEDFEYFAATNETCWLSRAMVGAKAPAAAICNGQHHQNMLATWAFAEGMDRLKCRNQFA
jgi:hypothetical protein